jgi:HK97 family phage major capsid protein
MNTNTVALIRKFKDADGNYLWRPGLMDGGPATLLGYPLVEAQDMPDLSTGSLSVAFGNFERGYVITDRTAVRVLRDPFSNKPYVHFYATKRVGGGVVNSEAIKLLKFTA